MNNGLSPKMSSIIYDILGFLREIFSNSILEVRGCLRWARKSNRKLIIQRCQ